MLIHKLDNVEVKLEDGHKYALCDIKKGENVIKYVMPIGHASCDIAKGDHVHPQNVATNLGDLLEYSYEPEFSPVAKVDDPRTDLRIIEQHSGKVDRFFTFQQKSGSP